MFRPKLKTSSKQNNIATYLRRESRRTARTRQRDDAEEKNKKLYLERKQMELRNQYLRMVQQQKNKKRHENTDALQFCDYLAKRMVQQQKIHAERNQRTNAQSFCDFMATRLEQLPPERYRKLTQKIVELTHEEIVKYEEQKKSKVQTNES